MLLPARKCKTHQQQPGYMPPAAVMGQAQVAEQSSKQHSNASKSTTVHAVFTTKKCVNATCDKACPAADSSGRLRRPLTVPEGRESVVRNKRGNEGGCAMKMEERY